MHGFDIKNSGEISRWHFLHSRYCMLKILFGDMTHLQAETLLGKLFLKSYIRVKTWNILRNVWDDDIVDRRYCRPLWCFFYWTILQMLAESWRSQWLGRTGYNYVDLCIRQTRTLVTLDPIPKRDGGGGTEGLCDILSMNQVTVWLHLSQRRNSTALPPTRLLGEGLTADGWADTRGICFTGRVSICGLRI